MSTNVVPKGILASRHAVPGNHAGEDAGLLVGSKLNIKCYAHSVHGCASIILTL
jgi:hypothetical protein